MMATLLTAVAHPAGADAGYRDRGRVRDVPITREAGR
jgi:hypothetical protein